ncbi:MAG: pirin family protein [Aliiglaciecola sp.]|uniref:pirin family protein n=1 Tax=Aliiglaciecola sp. TaxID=1872441 RepID=UPI00329A7781
MSNQSQVVEMPCKLVSGCGAIVQLIHPKEKDLGGFSVRRTLPNQQVKSIGPFIFFDHMGPASFSPGQGIDVRPHPHINIATVTYLFDGEILHRDSIGSEQRIRPGDLNLMVTGSGMVHSERESADVKNRPHSVHGLQLWLALPEKDEETAPSFHHYSANTLPQLEINGVAIRVMIGSAYGVTSPVKTFSPTLYVEAQIKAGQSLELPNAGQRGLYVVSGDVKLKDTPVTQHTMVVLDSAENVVVEATQDSQIALIGGENLGERYVDWNFVSSKKERIELAKQQWIDKKFPNIPNDSIEFIPYPSLGN